MKLTPSFHHLIFDSDDSVDELSTVDSCDKKPMVNFGSTTSFESQNHFWFEYVEFSYSIIRRELLVLQ